MKKTKIGNKFYTPLCEENSGHTAKTLGLRLGNKFILVDVEGHMSKFKKGDIVIFNRDDKTTCPEFLHEKTGETYYFSLYRLAKYKEEPKTFASNKNAKQLGIDIKKKFIVVKGNDYYKEGTIIKCVEDDDTQIPWFRVSRGSRKVAFFWDALAYAPEDWSNKKTPKRDANGRFIGKLVNKPVFVSDDNFIENLARINNLYTKEQAREMLQKAYDEGHTVGWEGQKKANQEADKFIENLLK